jgi:two-component system cell cycle response regulator CpdR
MEQRAATSLMPSSAKLDARPAAHWQCPQHERRAMTAKPSRLPARRILLAEDDDSMRAFIERALIKAGYEVVSFGNGREAYQRLRQEPFALLLTDIVMPQMDGIELARRASEIHPDLKIMFITGFAAVTLNTTTRAVKDAQVLSKPFHLKDLVREIDRLLAAPA